MPHFKCAGCRIRIRIPVGDEAGPLCPLCEAPLASVDDLRELVSFRVVQPEGIPADRLPAKRLARAVSDMREHDDRRVAELRLAAERWLDDGGSFDRQAEAAALDVPPRLDGRQ